MPCRCKGVVKVDKLSQHRLSSNALSCGITIWISLGHQQLTLVIGIREQWCSTWENTMCISVQVDFLKCTKMIQCIAAQRMAILPLCIRTASRDVLVYSDPHQPHCLYWPTWFQQQWFLYCKANQCFSYVIMCKFASCSEFKKHAALTNQL